MKIRLAKRLFARDSLNCTPSRNAGGNAKPAQRTSFGAVIRRSGAVLLTCAWAAILTAGLGVAADDKKPKADADGWVTIFDGKTFDGWKASENVKSWTIEDGAFVCHGERSHLFYTAEGDGSDGKPFQNFEFQCEVKTTPGSNGGIYFHTRYQEVGWPKYGHESQVNISHTDPIKTGSVYSVVKVTEPPAKDDEYWTQYIKVEGRNIQIKVNGKVVVDYTEPKNLQPDSDQFERRLGSGTFAFQAHDPKSKVYFRNVKVKRLP